MGVAPPDRIWIIGSDHWPRAYLRAELVERGYEAVGFETPRDAVSDLAAFPSRRPRLVVLDLHGQIEGDEGLDAILRAGVPVVAVSGPAEAVQEHALDHRWAAVLRRPITIGAIADAIGRKP